MKPIIFILFLLSGCAALMYEVVWLHLLRLTLGVSTYSLGVVLAVFMGGIALGSLSYASLISRDRHPLKVYAVLEWGIGGFGLAMPYLLPAANALYIGTTQLHEGSIFVRSLVAMLVLLPPTILMGATLPAISRWLTRDQHGAAQLGWFYGANIIGAVCGSLLAGLVLVQYFGAGIASFVAAAINGLVGIAAWLLASSTTSKWTVELEEQAAPVSSPIGSGDRPFPIFRLCAATTALFFSGMSALGAEVIWTRLLTLSFGPTVYAFSLVLAVFLAGLGGGSMVASALIPKIRHPLLGLGLCQLALLATIPLAAASFADQSLHPKSVWMLSAVAEWPATVRDLLRAIMTVLPSALFWGASFPLAVGAVFADNSDQARTVGVLSAANTIGAILGALGATFFFVPWFGTHVGQQALVFMSAFAAICCLLGHACSTYSLSHRFKTLKQMAGAVVILFLGTWTANYVLPPSPALFAYGREAPERRRDAPMLVVLEGVHTPIVVTYWPQHHRVRALHLEGKLVASDDKIDLRLERMLGHVPQFISTDPKSVLVVGLGAGITAGTFTMDDRTERLVICELEPALPPITAEHFAQANRNVLKDPRTELVIDDGRHYLQTTDEKFDVISVDPIHPWVRGAAALYSEEFFSHCLQHLRPGGLVSYWVPMHSMTTESVKCELATFFKVFPYATLWHTGGTMLQRHMLVVGSQEPYVLDLNHVDRLTPPGGHFEESILEMGFKSVDELLSLYIGDKANLEAWLTDAEINSDLNLRLEYLAGAAAYRNEREKIFRQIILHRGRPAELFRGNDKRIESIDQTFHVLAELEDSD